jgi:hypothetical protein
MASATIEAKAARLLVDGLVRVRWCSPGRVTATVRGDTGIHDVGLHDDRWLCTCAARRTCSHMTAVMRVTVPSPDDER